MKLAKRLGLPGAVRGTISGLASVLLAAGAPFGLFTTRERADAFMLPGDEKFSSDPGTGWTAGFAKAVLTPDDAGKKTYWLAGYQANNPARGVLDDMYARAVYLDDNTGRGGVVLCAVDCVGLSRRDVNEIREKVIGSGRIPGVRSILICSTHTHSAVDTQGLWGPSIVRDGKDKAFQNRLKERTAGAIVAAYEARKDGRLFLGTADVGDMLADIRTPVEFDPALTRLRFQPSDGSPGVYVVHMGCHPELLGSHTTRISADFPAYMGRELASRTGADFLFINGAIGGQISAFGIRSIHRDPDGDCERFMKDFGRRVGERVLAVENERELESLVNVRSQGVRLEGENPVFRLGKLLGIVNNDLEKVPRRLKTYVLTEVSYMELGDRQLGLFMLPGEIYYEFYSGKFMDAASSANGFAADYKPFSHMTDCERGLIVGLCCDALGYIIPDNDYYLHAWLGHLETARDRFDRSHYEETNSVGRNEARALVDAMDALTKSVR